MADTSTADPDVPRDAHDDAGSSEEPFFWVIFENSEKKNIKSLVNSRFFPRPDGAEPLPITDPRFIEHWRQIQAAMQPPPPTKISHLNIESIEDLFRLADQFDQGIPRPLYRGQGSYDWQLETGLERNVPEFVRHEVGLEHYEYRIITEAQRRLHNYFSERPDEDDRLSWLALLRHHGVPTRLLDVTRSLYVACHFAIRHAKPGKDAAIWIFSRLHINSEFSMWGHNPTPDILRTSPFTVAQYGEPYYWPIPRSTPALAQPPTLDSIRQGDDPWLDYVATFDAAIRGYIEKPGLAAVEPSWISRRLDVQQGAFLVPFNVRVGFEENLSSYLGISMDQQKEVRVPTDSNELFQLWAYFKVIKLRLPALFHPMLRAKLESMNIRELTLFPDIDGAITHLSDIVPRELS